MEVTAAQLAKLQQNVTRPIFGVHWKHSGEDEYISCTGAFELDSQDYTPAGLNILTVLNSSAARLSMPATAARIGQIQSGTWRNQICKLYHVPAEPGDTLEFTTADQILYLDGIINLSSWTAETITVEVINKYLTGRTGPIATLNAICNWIPAPGTTFEWEGESQVIESQESVYVSELRLGPGTGY